VIGALVGRWLGRHKILVIVVTLGLFVFEAGLVHIAAAFDGGAGLNQIVELLPSLFRDLAKEHVRDLTADGVVSLGFNHPVAMTVMCAMIALFATSTAADREEGLLGLVLARPVSRQAYLASQVVCVILLSVVFPAVLLAGGFVGLAMVDLPGAQEPSAHVVTAVGLCLLLLAVGGLALLFGVSVPRRGVAVTWLAGLLVPLYLLEFLGFLWSGLDAVRWISPFHYMPQVASMVGGDGSAVGPWPLAALALVTGALAFRRFADGEA
jgi:putative exporter of polyketide antibiotics